MNHFEKFESYIPLDLLSPGNFLLASLVLSAIVVFRYFLVAGAFWWAFYRLQPAGIKKRQIYNKLPDAKLQWSEIRWSITASVIFGIGGAAMGVLWQLGWTQIYLPFNEYPLWYLPFSFLILSFFHDLYFYLTHRMLHWPWLFKKAHYVHHQSLTPSPWASFSFHPIESLIEAAALPLLVLFIPVHPVILLIYLTVMTISAVTNHSGFEVLPAGSARHWLGKYLISGVHHTQHHRFYKYNYGLFFTFWDRWLKTEHAGYADSFDQVVNGRKS